MPKPSSRVMGRIDMFSMLRTLLVRLSRMMDEQWVQPTRFLRKVWIFSLKFNNHVLMCFPLSGCCVFRDPGNASLDLHSAFLRCRKC